MYKAGLAPYDGVIFHETPLALVAFSVLQGPFVHWLFLLGDLLTALCLAKLGKVVAQQRLVQQEAERRGYSKEAQPLLATISATLNAHRSMALAFLLNPYIIANCAAMTSTVWANLLLAIFLLSLVSGWMVPACVTLALATYQSLYPILLLLPLLLNLTKRLESRNEKLRQSVKICSVFAVSLALLLVLSAEICGDWSFLGATYGFILSVPELTPNMGIFWYKCISSSVTIATFEQVLLHRDV